MSEKYYLIAIDTGGTFTDCISITPEGNVKTCKVLSNSTLRGSIVRILNKKTIEINTNWQLSSDIFKGFDFKILNTPLSYTHKIESFDPQNKILKLNKPLNNNVLNKSFEITSQEEAPVLAARLITETALDANFPPLLMRLGSTKGTNALLEMKGAKTALLVTKGFKDVLKIGNQQRPDLFALHIQKPEMLYDEVIEIDERLDKDGFVLKIPEKIKKLPEKHIKSIAISLVHGYKNPVHEQQLRGWLQEHFDFISLSSEMSGQIKYVPRTETTVVNAYLAPIIHQYIQNIVKKLPEKSLRVMTSAGALTDSAHFLPKDSLLSGPAGGVVGAAYIGKQSGYNKLITFDMGGTSTDVARFDGDFDYIFETKIGHATVFSPALNIETVAAGGGSICYFDGFKLCVGPESAGASPGPACYGAGGPLTITDVNLLLGRMDASQFGIPIFIEKAREKLAEIKQNILIKTQNTLSDEEILRGFLAIADERMAEAIKKISIAKGYAPPQYALVAFGGAGGMHACSMAQLLDIPTILLPQHAGLLSAYGIMQAKAEFFSEKQVLKTLDTLAERELAHFFNEIENNAFEKAINDGFKKEAVFIKKRSLFLRLKGQDASLEVPFEGNFIAVFKEKYINIYGHWSENRPIEVEIVRVIVAEKEDKNAGKTSKNTAKITATPRHFIQSYVNGAWQDAPVYFRSDLTEGSTIEGFALLLDNYSTTVIERGYTLTMDENGTAIIEKQNENILINKNNYSQTIELELFTNRFQGIAYNMGVMLQRTALSVNVKERLDFSCALLDAEGYLIANAPHIPVHLGSLGVCVRSVLQSCELADGDTIVTNHPAFGGSHLPDVTLITPVFTKSVPRQLIGYVCNRCHHSEIGGIRPGSMPPNATNLVQEGVVIKPTFLVKMGVVKWENIQKMLENAPYPTRNVGENLADLNAALASNLNGVQALQQLVEEHGLEKVHFYMRKLKNYTAEKINDSLNSKFTEGTYEATETLDDGSVLKVKISFLKNKNKTEFEKIIFDFTGSSAVHKGNLNATKAIVNSVVIYVLRLLLDENIPLNEGIMQNIELVLPEKSILNPHFTENDAQNPAVVGGNVETSQRLTDTILKALGVLACGQGTMNNVLFGNEKFGYYETICGGSGAGAGFNGTDAVHTHMTNTRITDPEILEFRYPVRLEKFEIRTNSGGKGKFSGGNGVIRQLKFLEPVALSVLSQHRIVAPFGAQGGHEGKCGAQYIILKNKRKKILEGIDSYDIKEGETFVIETPGGGGFFE